MAKPDFPSRIDVHVHIEPNSQILAKLDQILAAVAGVTKLEQQEIITLTELEDKVTALETKVAAEGDVITSAETLLTSINQMLKDALAGGGSPAAVVARVQALADSVDAKTAELAASVAANTPAAPTP